MLALRPAQERGTANIGWLNSAHSFSFGNYYDPNYMGFASLRVINEDIVAPGQGFATHGHRDMEIVTYVLDGALEHKDSLGNGSVIRPGDIQRMSAGTGILHSEYNPSPTDSVHLLQIWLLPNRNNLEPSYEQVYIAEEQKTNQLRLIGSSDGRDGSVTIHQDVNLYATQLQAGAKVHTEVSSDRAIWVQVARGEITLNDQPLAAGDGAGLTQVTSLTLTGVANDSEVLLFDMARLDTAA